jgi:hypothetical protein
MRLGGRGACRPTDFAPSFKDLQRSRRVLRAAFALLRLAVGRLFCEAVQ